MNKADLINKVSEVLSSKKDAQAAVDCTIRTITEALSGNDSVKLVGFGTFKTANRKARKGRNPQTGKEINIPEKNVLKFVPGKTLKDTVKF